MVKVREDQSLTGTGRVDVDLLLERLQENVRLRDPAEMRVACLLVEQLDRESDRPHCSWLKDTPSFRMGLEMADILGELKLDQTALEAAVLYRALREERPSPGAGRRCARLS